MVRGDPAQCFSDGRWWSGCGVGTVEVFKASRRGAANFSSEVALKPLIKFNSFVDGRSATLQIDGELDIATRDQLVEQLRQLEALAVDVICLDVADVSFIDCSCLGVLH